MIASIMWVPMATPAHECQRQATLLREAGERMPKPMERMTFGLTMQNFSLIFITAHQDTEIILITGPLLKSGLASFTDLAAERRHRVFLMLAQSLRPKTTEFVRNGLFSVWFITTRIIMDRTILAKVYLV